MDDDDRDLERLLAEARARWLAAMVEAGQSWTEAVLVERAGRPHSVAVFTMGAGFLGDGDDG
jgi:hypothetical protein